MTCAQLFARLTRPLNSKVPTGFSDENKQFLVDAANTGLNVFTQYLPSMRLQEPRSERLTASVVQSVEVVQSAASLTFSPPWTDVGKNLGRSVILGGDPGQYNRLQTPTTLLNTYEGATGTTTLEVLSDAVMIGQSFEVSGDVILMDGPDTYALTYGPPYDSFPGKWRATFGLISGDAAAAQRSILKARPTNWWIEPLNGITGKDVPSFLLRVWPQPDKLYKLNFNLRLWPTALTVDDLDSTVVLPIQPNEEAHFLALCFPTLFPCTLWQGTGNKDDYQTAADRATAMLAGNETNRGHQQPGRVRTKPGY